jgi:hypothetical protein
MKSGIWALNNSRSNRREFYAGYLNPEDTTRSGIWTCWKERNYVDFKTESIWIIRWENNPYLISKNLVSDSWDKKALSKDSIQLFERFKFRHQFTWYLLIHTFQSLGPIMAIVFVNSTINSTVSAVSATQPTPTNDPLGELFPNLPFFLTPEKKGFFDEYGWKQIWAVITIAVLIASLFMALQIWAEEEEGKNEARRAEGGAGRRVWACWEREALDWVEKEWQFELEELEWL